MGQLSVVVCTRNRSAQLRVTLQRLLRLSFPAPWELVIVDNGSTDATNDVISALLQDHPPHVTPVAIMDPKPGLGRARNSGWHAATGEIIAFTDDDCYPAEDFLESVMRVFGESDAIGFTGGRVLLHDPEDLAISIQLEATRQDISPGDFVSTGLIHGANFAFRRTALVSVKGFDERFGSGTRFACEDCDILARMLGEGWKGVYDPRLVVSHHHGRKTSADARKLRTEYIRGRGAYYAKSILNPKLSLVYARQWYWAILRQPFEMSAKEMIAGAEYLMRSLAPSLVGIWLWRRISSRKQGTSEVVGRSY